MNETKSIGGLSVEMLKYVIKRLLMMIPVVLGVLIIVFFFQSISNDDPTVQILGSGASAEAREAKREELGLNDPVTIQFGRYVYKIVTQGDLGTSYKTNEPVTSELMTRFPLTIKLALVAIVLGILIGMPLGIWAAVRQYTAVDSIIVTFSVLVESMPNFWLALLLISFFSVKLRWLPTTYDGTAGSWILPIVVVTFGSISMIIRVTRSSMLETIRQDYVRTARAKGQTEFRITMSHVLRNSLIPIINAIGNTIGMLLGGALIVETIFGMPGIGKYAVDAITARNYPAVLGSVVVLAVTFTIVNLLVDLTYAFVDPKVKTSLIAEERLKSNRRSKKRKTSAEEVA
jgi:peptide/nickel transport system permease protein